MKEPSQYDRREEREQEERENKEIYDCLRDCVISSNDNEMSTIDECEREYKDDIRSSYDLTREEMTDYEKYLEDISECPRNVVVRISYGSRAILSLSGLYDCDEETKKVIEKLERAHAEGKGLAIKLKYIIGGHNYAAFPDPIDSKLSCSKCVDCGLISYLDENHYELRKATLKEPSKPDVKESSKPDVKESSNTFVKKSEEWDKREGEDVEFVKKSEEWDKREGEDVEPESSNTFVKKSEEWDKREGELKKLKDMQREDKELWYMVLRNCKNFINLEDLDEMDPNEKRFWEIEEKRKEEDKHDCPSYIGLYYKGKLHRTFHQTDKKIKKIKKIIEHVERAHAQGKGLDIEFKETTGDHSMTTYDDPDYPNGYRHECKYCYFRIL